MPRTADRTCTKRRTCSRKSLDVLGCATEPAVQRAPGPQKVEIWIMMLLLNTMSLQGRKQPGARRKSALKCWIPTPDKRITGLITVGQCSTICTQKLVSFWNPLAAECHSLARTVWQGSHTPSLDSSKEHPPTPAHFLSWESACSNIQSDCKCEDGPNCQEGLSQR